MFNTNQTLPSPLLSFYSATPSTTHGTLNNDEKSDFRLSVVKPKLVLSQRPMWRKENTLKSHWELKVKTTKQPKARENADQAVIGFRVASDWLRKRCEFSGPITERSKAIPKQSQNSFDTQLKIALTVLKWINRIQQKTSTKWWFLFEHHFQFDLNMGVLLLGRDKVKYWTREIVFDFQVVGSQARILYSDQRGRVALAEAFNMAIRDGILSVSSLAFWHAFFKLCNEQFNPFTAKIS